MKKPVLYLFIGSPGAGKTTVAQIIAEATGAVHLWADHERHQLFTQPSHSQQESLELYDLLNQRTKQLLADGQSVIFDTNFNFYTDRQKLRDIAARHHADTLIIWMTTPENIAKERSVYATTSRNGYDASMTEEKFQEITSKLETPHTDEKVIKINGTKIDRDKIIALVKG